ncbi:hypothetical protein [Confluentibacter citreus]|uniref:hypothetical protein n=1 Tax=Confluentibacter citreus TaxID=2007307 RepID=UPI000C28A7F4|nr:hypothetical protein [Confluentibacter citreus]
MKALMKTIKQQIRITALLFFFMSNISVSAQKEIKKHNIFIRVYNLDGKMISKGRIAFLNDSFIGLKKNKNIEISIHDIGFIKTKQSPGNNIIIGAATGAALGAVLIASSSSPNDWIFPYTPAEGGLIGGFSGALVGGALGGITILFKHSSTYIINGDLEKWQVFKSMIEKQIFK